MQDWSWLHPAWHASRRMRIALFLATAVTALWLSACSPTTGDDADASTLDAPSLATCDPALACLEKGAVECSQGASRTCAFDSLRGCLQWSGWTTCSALADACHQGWCTPGVGCEMGEVICDDANPCTNETCDPKKGCKTTLNDGADCDDGSLCTKKDQCFQGFCHAGAPLACQVQDACHAVGACDPATGTCSNPAAADGTSCSDGAACTFEDTCAGGVCVAGPCGDNWSCDQEAASCTCGQGYAGAACNECAPGYESSGRAVVWGKPSTNG